MAEFLTLNQRHVKPLPWPPTQIVGVLFLILAVIWVVWGLATIVKSLVTLFFTVADRDYLEVEDA